MCNNADTKIKYPPKKQNCFCLLVAQQSLHIIIIMQMLGVRNNIDYYYKVSPKKQKQNSFCFVCCTFSVLHIWDMEVGNNVDTKKYPPKKQTIFFLYIFCITFITFIITSLPFPPTPNPPSLSVLD